ncbi:hypothetical protein ACHAW6_006870 [Cyclotella cf. meneghiniana]
MPRPSGLLPKRIRLPFFLFCYTAALLTYYNSTEFFPFHTQQHDQHNYDSPVLPVQSWNPSTYLALARSGPRRCRNAPCYIVDVIPDPHRPRIFLILLGLPASDIPRHQRGNVTHVDMIDVRTGDSMRMVQSATLENETHGLAILLQCPPTGMYVMASCRLLKQDGVAMNAFSESMTYACDLPRVPLRADSTPIRIDVLLAPLNLGAAWGMGIRASSYWNLNGPERPFYISSRGGVTSGLFNSVSRRRIGTKPSIWHDGGRMHSNTTVNENATASKKIPIASVCLIGVDYASPQHREVIQYYLTLGFHHIYLGVPLWPTSQTFRQTWDLLQDFVFEGTLSMIVSEYAAEFIEPDRFGGRNFTYAPQGHKSSFVNTCILVARSAGDDLAFVADIDELLEHRYGNRTSIGEAILLQLSSTNTTLDSLCAINFGSLGGMYHPRRSGSADPAKIVEKLAGVGPIDDSVSTYGKSVSNVRRVLRVGLHGAAYCEMPDVADNATEDNVVVVGGGSEINAFRPGISDVRILHLTDSYKQRSAPWMIERVAREEKKFVSYYVRDFSELVSAELDRRDRDKRERQG